MILGLAGRSLSADERALFRDSDPLGFIVFARNVEDPMQLGELVASLRDTVGRADAPVLIDQEGGRVARLGPPHWRAAPAAAVFARLAASDAEVARDAARLNAQLIGAELHHLGINVDCAPVLDIPVAGADAIIGDRALGTDAAMVTGLGDAVCDGLVAAGVLPVLKHVPGHGRAGVDSHKALPRIGAPADQLERQDFVPFRALARRQAPQPWAMTAHVVFEAFDPVAPATMSATVIGQVVRGLIGFDGVLISDDLSMGALSGSLRARAQGALAAGCDVVLHCNGNMAEMRDIVEGVTGIGSATETRLARSLGQLPAPAPFDRDGALARLNALIAPFVETSS